MMKKNGYLLLAPIAAGTLLANACVTDAGPAETSAQQAVSGCNGAASYIDENGEEVICVYTEEPGDDPPDDPPVDWCLWYPELCAPADPPDPCELDPDRCAPPADPPAEEAACTENRHIKVPGVGRNANEEEARQEARRSAMNAANTACQSATYPLLLPFVCRGHGSKDDEFSYADGGCVGYRTTEPDPYYVCSTSLDIACLYHVSLVF